jgi:hypothetical protein
LTTVTHTFHQSQTAAAAEENADCSTKALPLSEWLTRLLRQALSLYGDMQEYDMQLYLLLNAVQWLQ